MTEDEFFALLRQSERKWEVVGDSFIRTCDLSPGTGMVDCPITAAYYAVKDGSVDAEWVRWAGERLGLDKDFIDRVIMASDCHLAHINDPETFRLRVRLLAEVVWK